MQNVAYIILGNFSHNQCKSEVHALRNPRLTQLVASDSQFPLLHQLNTTTRTLYAYFIFMQTLNSQSEWKDNFSD